MYKAWLCWYLPHLALGLLSMGADLVKTDFLQGSKVPVFFKLGFIFILSFFVVEIYIVGFFWDPGFLEVVVTALVATHIVVSQ